MNTTISISKDTRALLQDFGKKSESYDDIIRRMVNYIKLQDEASEFMREEGWSTLNEAESWTKEQIKKLK